LWVISYHTTIIQRYVGVPRHTTTTQQQWREIGGMAIPC
jgi:hypothetical protein